jgi:Holliday junction DNA helicase RuvB
MSSIVERELMFRNLAGNPTASRIAQRAIELEDEGLKEEEARRSAAGPGQTTYPWMGFEWHQVPAQTQTLNQLVVDGLLVTGGPRGTFKSNSSQTYKLKDPELVRECLEDLREASEGAEEGEIPNDLFDFILGQDDIKNLLWKSINSPSPVHVLLVGPPASSKSMFLGELARLPFSRFTLGGGTTKAGLSDFLLEFRPKYLIIDEIDKMAPADMSILLSLMESGVIARLKKRMREIETMKTWVFAAANRDERIWPELKSRFFSVHLREYSEADFISISRAVLISREKVDPQLASYIASSLARHTRDVRDTIHIGRLCKTQAEVSDLVKLKWPERRLA